MPHPFFALDRPLVIGHRGSAGTHPENTLTSFSAALRDGAHVLESDIHVSRDGVPILLHDPEVDRVTSASGEAVNLDWSELRQLDAGYHFQPIHNFQPTKELDFPFRGQALRIPSLEEAFDAFPNARFNLEVKSPDAAAIAATLDLIARFDRADRTLLAAGDDEIMRALRRQVAAHEVRPALGASLAEIVGAVTGALGGEAMPKGVMALQVPPDFAGNPLVTPELISHAHAHGVEVHVWTVNDVAEIEHLLDLGADGIVTDYPGRMTEWLASRV